MTGPHFLRPQHGAITLLVSIALVILASLTSFYSARSVLMDQLASQNHAHAHQARLAAQAALASAQALLASTPLQDVMNNPTYCPTGLSGMQWQCSNLAIAPHPALAQAQLSAVAVRDLLISPHVITLYASARISEQHSLALVRESMFAPFVGPAPDLAAPAALVLHGCVSPAAAAQLRVCPLTNQGQTCVGTPRGPALHTHWAADNNLDGQISNAEINACLALNPSSLPGGGSLSGPNAVSVRSPCTRAAWRSVLGDITDAQLQHWSTAQALRGLTAQTTPPRTVYWIDSPADWMDNVGTPDHPVLLVFSAQACALRCPRIGLGVRILGSVLIDSGCDDEKMRGWQSGTIEGQLVVESGLPDWRAGTVLAQPNGRKAYTLHWPQGIDASRLQRIQGSWSEGAP